MDRFTWKAPDGTYQIDNPKAAHRTTCFDENFRNAFVIYEGAAIDRLGQYEDTGLTPEEITVLQRYHDLYTHEDAEASKYVFGLIEADKKKNT